MKELNQALSSKAELINAVLERRVNDYYYNVKVRVKHKTSICGINAEPYWTEHDELRFKDQKYNQDLGGINATIQQYLAQITELTSSLDRLTAKKEIVVEIKEEITKSENTKKATEAVLAQTKANLVACIQKLTAIDRASIVACEFTNPDSEFLIESIYELGFDANVLATIAIDTSDSNLLDFALNAGADLDKHLVQEKTLMQHAIMQGNQSIISQSIAATKNFESSLLYAVLQNDMVSLKQILSVHPEIASELLFADYNLAHYAISNNQMEVLSYIMQVCPKALKVNNSNDDSSFKLALRSGSSAMVSLVSQHVDLANEFVDLKRKGDVNLIDRAIQLNLEADGFVAIEEEKQALEDIVHVAHNSSFDSVVIGNIESEEIDII